VRGWGSTNRQIRSLVLCVDLIGSRPIWPGQVGRVVDLDGSRRVPSDRLDDQQMINQGRLGERAGDATTAL
jgi:hypothetical protein